MTVTQWIAEDGTTLALDGTTGVKVQRGAAGLDGRPIANTIDQRIGDGAVRIQKRRPAAPFLLPLLLDLDFVSTAQVVAAFQGPGTLVHTSGRVLREIIHEDGSQGVWSVDTGGITGLGHRKFPLAMLALDPYWQSTGTTATLAWAAPTAFDAAIAFDAALPFDGGSSNSVTNGGDVPVPVQVEFTGPLTTAVVIVGNRQVELATVLTAGRMLVFRGDPGGEFYLSKQGSVGPHLVGDPIDHSLVSQDSEPLVLGKGANSVIVQHVTGDDANSQIRVLFNERFLTP